MVIHTTYVIPKNGTVNYTDIKYYIILLYDTIVSTKNMHKYFYSIIFYCLYIFFY